MWSDTKSCGWFLSPGSFYNLPSVNDFIIDVLLGSPSGEVNNTLFLLNRNISPTLQQCVFTLAVSVSSFLSDPPCSLWSALHSEPDGHFSLRRGPETQLVPHHSHSHCSAAVMESYIYHERGQPEVLDQETHTHLHPWIFSSVLVLMLLFFSGCCPSARSTLT